MDNNDYKKKKEFRENLMTNCAIKLASKELIDIVKEFGELRFVVSGEVVYSYLVRELYWSNKLCSMLFADNDYRYKQFYYKEKERVDEAIKNGCKPYHGILIREANVKCIDNISVDGALLDAFLNTYMGDYNAEYFFVFAPVNLVKLIDVNYQKNMVVGLSDEEATKSREYNRLGMDLYETDKYGMSVEIQLKIDDQEDVVVMEMKEIKVYNEKQRPVEGRDDDKLKAQEYIKNIEDNQEKLRLSVSKYKNYNAMDNSLFWTEDNLKIKIPQNTIASDELYNSEYKLKEIFGQDSATYLEVLRSLKVKDFFEYINNYFYMPTEMAIEYRKLMVVEMISVLEAIIKRMASEANKKCNRLEMVDTTTGILGLYPCENDKKNNCDYFFPTKINYPAKRNLTIVDYLKILKKKDLLRSEFSYCGWGSYSGIIPGKYNDYYDFLVDIYEIRNYIHLGTGYFRNIPNRDVYESERIKRAKDILGTDAYIKILSDCLPKLARSVERYMISDICLAKHNMKMNQEDLSKEAEYYDLLNY